MSNESSEPAADQPNADQPNAGQSSPNEPSVNQPTVRLLAALKESGQPVFEEVPVDVLGSGRFRLLASPGILDGLARGDVFTVDPDSQSYRVDEHGGNLCAQVWYPGLDLAGRIDAELSPQVVALGGSLDGREQELSSFTVPLSAGMATIQAVFDAWVDSTDGATWSFGNADEEDGRTPLPWLSEALDRGLGRPARRAAERDGRRHLIEAAGRWP
ncbi:MAG: DUF4265 domain-containing protein [Candidatus Limnocylindrales bacterium]